MNELRIAAPIWHEPIIHYLCKAGHIWDLIDLKVLSTVPRQDNATGWNLSKRPLPDNATIISDYNEFKTLFDKKTYDLLICFTPFDLQTFELLKIPKLFFPTYSLRNYMGELYNDKAVREKELALITEWAKDYTVAYLSETMGDEKSGGYGLPGQIVAKALIDYKDYDGEFTGNIPVILRVGNMIDKRKFLNYELQQEVFNDIPIYVIGNNPLIPSSKPAKNWDELKYAYKNYRAFFSTLDPEILEVPATMSQLEAMASGMPVIATPHPLSIIKDGANGYVASQVEELKEKARLLLENRESAKKLGENARATIKKLYPFEEFQKTWQEVLEKCISEYNNKKKTVSIALKQIKNQEAPLSQKINSKPKILMAQHSFAGSIAHYYYRALQNITDIITCGSHLNVASAKSIDSLLHQHALKEENHEKGIGEELLFATNSNDITLPKGMVSVKSAIEKSPAGWHPDIFLWIDSNGEFVPDDLHTLKIPKVGIFVDLYEHNLKWKLEYAKNFDFIFLVDKRGMNSFKAAGLTNVFWLPPAADPQMHFVANYKELYDIGFVGQTIKEWHYRRVSLLELLRKEGFNVVVVTKVLREMALFLSECKISFNCSFNGGINMRVFEAMAAGSMLLTDALSPDAGLEPCFEIGKHLVVYNNEKDLLTLARFYLENREERITIAKAGQEHVLANHTYLHRAIEIINKVLGANRMNLPFNEKREEANNNTPISITSASIIKSSPANDIVRNLYKKIAHAFEGEENVLRERRMRWMEIFKGCNRVLDVGSGNGLFLDLLKEAGIPGIGMDWDPEVVEQSRKKGYDVFLADVQKFPDVGKVDGIFMGHIIEHLEGEDALNLLYNCTDFLAPGGILVVLTPNIQHPVVLSNFWMDITHKRPYPANLLQQMLIELGYHIQSVGLLESDCECYVIGRKKIESLKSVNGSHSKTSQVTIHWKGAFFDPSGYGDEARNFVYSLREDDIPLKITGITKPSPTFIEALPEENLSKLEYLVQTELSTPYVQVVHFPAYAFNPDPGAKVNIGRVMFESDSLPKDWVDKCNAMDEIWVPSLFNFETFKNAGVKPEKLVVIPGGVDSDFFTPSGTTIPLPGEGRYRFLSIFEWLYRKGWDILITAYISEFSANEPVALLLRVYPYGDVSSQNAKIIEETVFKFIENKLGKSRSEIPPIYFLKELIPQEQMPALYRSCDAYVMPSRGEGWGKPYIEAMACGKPVIATAWGGQMEYMHKGNSFLIDVDGLETIDNRCELNLYWGHKWAKPSINSLRQLMRHLFTNQEEAKQIAKMARIDVETNWTWKKAAAVIKNRIKKPHKNHSENKIGLVWEGSFLVNHSLANANREIVLSLNNQKEIALSLIPYEPNQISDEEDPRFKTITKLCSNCPDAVDFHIRHMWPPNWNMPKEGEYILIQPWEFGSLPVEWKNNLPKVREVWAYSNYVRDIYLRAGYPETMAHVVPLGINSEQFTPLGERWILTTKKNFRFLFVGGLIPRKGIDLLLEAYLNEFRPHEDVCLVIKDFYYQSPYVEKVEELSRRSEVPEIVYLHGATSPENLPKLYRSCQCYVHPYRGEGFGLPILEAMASGLPVITTEYGPSSDYCNPELTYLIPSLLKSTGDNKVDTLLTVDEVFYAEPDLNMLRRMMRHVYNNYLGVKRKSMVASQLVHKYWNWDNTSATITNRLKVLKQAPPHSWSFRPPMPVAALIQNHNPNFYLRQAKALSNMGDYNNALQLLKSALDSKEPSASDLFLMSHLLFASNDKDDSKKTIKQVHSRYDELSTVEQQNFYYIASLLGETSLVSGYPDKLIRETTNELERINLAIKLAKLGDKPTAQKILTTCLNDGVALKAEAAYHLGVMAEEEGGVSLAYSFMEKATELFPAHPFAWKKLAELASLLDDSLTAEAAYMQAVACEPWLGKKNLRLP